MGDNYDTFKSQMTTLQEAYLQYETRGTKVASRELRKAMNELRKSIPAARKSLIERDKLK